MNLNLKTNQTFEKDEGYESGSEVGKEQVAKHLAESTKLKHAAIATQDNNILDFNKNSRKIFGVWSLCGISQEGRMSRENMDEYTRAN